MLPRAVFNYAVGLHTAVMEFLITAIPSQRKSDLYRRDVVYYSRCICARFLFMYKTT